MKRCSTAAGVNPACRAFSTNRANRSAVNVAFSRIVQSVFAMRFLSAGAENPVGSREDALCVLLGELAAVGSPVLQIACGVFEAREVQRRATEQRGAFGLDFLGGQRRLLVIAVLGFVRVQEDM